MNASLLSKIKTLPPLPETVVKIQQLCSNPESSVGDLIKIVETDPMITANLLKAANSPFYGFSREIQTVSQAVSLFGMSTVKGLAVSGVVKKLLAIDLDPYGISPQAFADISGLQNALMHDWYAKIDASAMSVLSPASFLQETGKIVIAQEITKEGKAREFRADIESGAAIASVEAHFLGETTATVTAAIFEHWRFEEQLVESIRYADAPTAAPAENAPFSKALHVVKTALRPAGTFGEEHLEEAVVAASGFGFSESSLRDAFTKLKERTNPSS